ncbi:MAG: glycosyltransferase [Planctomycetaceae bacterium]|nr:glycosyltransferase [Planctomycetaceae bacterium]
MQVSLQNQLPQLPVDPISRTPTSQPDLPRIHVIITTFDRQETLRSLLHQIEDYASLFSISVDVFDDGTPEFLPLASKVITVRVFQRAENGGKTAFWHLIHTALCHARSVEAEYYVFLQDDVQLCQRFFSEAVRKFEAIRSVDPRCECLNLLSDESRRGRECWTGYSPRHIEVAGESFFQTQWTDMVFLAGRSFLDLLQYRIHPVTAGRWRRNPTASSGAGEQISRRVHEAGRSIYQVEQSLVDHGVHASRMHPELRTRQPLVAKRTDHVIGGLATIPERALLLRKNLPAILRQVDRLYVCLNGYDAVPEFLSDPRIDCWIEQGDRGDAAKFTAFEDVNGYFLSMDDDIAYPDGYSSRLTTAIDAYHRRCCVGFHGACIPGRLRSFYQDRWLFHASDALEDDQPVHLLGTGLMGVHSSTLRLTAQDFRQPNMADIWVALAAQKQCVGMVVLAHEADWIQFDRTEQSIYEQFAERDQEQTNAVNSIADWKLFACASVSPAPAGGLL